MAPGVGGDAGLCDQFTRVLCDPRLSGAVLILLGADLGLRSRESSFALLAAPSLNLAASIGSESLARFVLAAGARHFGLAFFGPMEPK